MSNSCLQLKDWSTIRGKKDKELIEQRREYQRMKSNKKIKIEGGGLNSSLVVDAVDEMESQDVVSNNGKRGMKVYKKQRELLQE